MSSRSLFLLAALAGTATFAAALYFQYVEGLAPCKLCIVQRYGLAAGILGAGLAAMMTGRGAMIALGALGALGFLFEAGAAFYHTGVERKWWEGPSTCSGSVVPETFDPAALAAAAAQGKPVPRCDEIPWEFMGLSMANWNVALALGFAALCIAGMTRAQRSSFAPTATA